jgi:hypothetical protein
MTEETMAATVVVVAAAASEPLPRREARPYKKSIMRMLQDAVREVEVHTMSITAWPIVTEETALMLRAMAASLRQSSAIIEETTTFLDGLAAPTAVAVVADGRPCAPKEQAVATARWQKEEQQQKTFLMPIARKVPCGECHRKRQICLDCGQGGNGRCSACILALAVCAPPCSKRMRSLATATTTTALEDDGDDNKDQSL